MTASATVFQAGIQEGINHVFTGGSAFMAFMLGEELPAVKVLSDKN